MVKRKSATSGGKKYNGSKKTAYQAPKKRTGYETVPRSRGVYATGEMKYFDTEHTAVAITVSATWAATEILPNVGTPNTLCCPTVGSAINQRIARSINVHKVSVRGVINIPAQTNQTVTDAAVTIRYALVHDSQTNAAQAQGETIFAAPTTASAIHACQSFQALTNLGRFNVLKDKTIKIQNPSISYDGTNIEQTGLLTNWKCNHRYKTPQKVSFNAVNGGTIADIVDHSWAIYANASTAGLAATMMFQARVYYKE